MMCSKQLMRAGVFLCVATTITACGGGGESGASAPTAPELDTGYFTQYFRPVATHDSIIPFGDGSFGDVKYQNLYLADEVDGSGNITALKFTLFNTLATTVTCPNTTIRLGQTSLDELTSNFGTNVNQGRGSQITVLNNATITIPAGASGAEFEIELTTAFDYNGIDNLVVEIERTTECSGGVEIATIAAANTRRAESVEEDAAAGIAQHDTTTAGSISNSHALQGFVFSGGENFVQYNYSTANGIPFAQSNVPEFRHAQLLYHANAINGAGPITGVAFIQAQSVTSAASYIVNIKMAHSSLSELTTSYADNFNVSSPVTVASNLTFTVAANIPSGRPIWIPLTGAFNYNGTDNLIVDIEVSGGIAPSLFIRGNPGITGRRLYAAVGSNIGTVDDVAYDTIFRFHGSSMQIAPQENPANVIHVFGGTSGGQIQNLYRPTYLGTGGTITSVAVRFLATPQAAAIPNFKLYLGQTSKTQLSAVDTFVSNMDNHVLAYSGTLNVASTFNVGDWLTIPLQTPFSYDPTKNLVVMFSGDGSGVTNAASGYVEIDEFAGHAVGNSSNVPLITETPDWEEDGAVSIRLGISK